MTQTDNPVQIENYLAFIRELSALCKKYNLAFTNMFNETEPNMEARFWRRDYDTEEPSKPIFA